MAYATKAQLDAETAARKAADAAEAKTRAAADAALAARVAVLEKWMGTQSVAPAPIPPAAASVGLGVGVVAVQNETSAGGARLGTGVNGVFGGHHTHAWGSNDDYPSDINTYLGWMGSAIPKVLYSFGPSSISTANPNINADGCRLNDTAACVTFANQCVEYINANSTITHANFWNEMKGYGWGGTQAERDMYYSHYIAWATRMKAVKPAIKLGGPYSTSVNDAQLRLIHQGFIDQVVKPHGDLVDFICWDYSDGEKLVEGAAAHLTITGYYTAAGITLPHMMAEWYPGDQQGVAPSVGDYARLICRIATNPRMRWLMHWGGGSDGAMLTALWNSAGTPTAYWTALNTVTAFTYKGGVTTINADSWRNAAGQTLLVSGNTITVT